MKKNRISLKLSQFSFYLFCSYPLLILLPLKGMLAVAFLLCQTVLLFLDKPPAKTKGFWLPIILSLPFLFYSISLSYSQDVMGGYKYVERTILLLVMPYLLYYNRSTISAATLRNSFRFLVLIMTLLSAYSIGSMLLEGTFISASHARDSYYVIRTKLESLSGLHPTYFSILNATAALSILYEVKSGSLKRLGKVFASLTLLVLIATMLLASSKMILVASLVSALIIYSVGLSVKAFLVRFALVLVLGSLLIISVRPLKERALSFIEAVQQSEVEEHNPDSMRKAIYQSTWELIGEQVIFGTGIGDAQEALNRKYQEKGYSLAKERGFNTHNQYLQLWLSVGILPFSLFILSVLLQFLIAMIAGNRLHIGFVVLIAMAFLSENLLARQDGIFFYALFSSFFCYASWSLYSKKVFINGRYLSQSLTGVQRFAREIVAELQKANLNIFILGLNGVVKEEGEKRTGLFSKLNGQLWEQFILPFYLRLIGSPLLINLGNSAPILYSNSIICLHDVAFLRQPTWFSATFVRWYNYMVPRIVKSARHIITVSDFSRKEIMHYYKVQAAKISVLYNGQPTFSALESVGQKSKYGDYALSVGSFSERKNQKFLVEAYLKLKQPNFKLVLAGTINEDLFKDQSNWLNEARSNDQIILIESPNDIELASLYAQAKFCVFVPLYEGFGIPVLEAFAFKKPIIVSDIPVFKELYSPYVLFSELGNNDNLRKKLEEMNSSTEIWSQKLDDFAFEEHGFSYRASAEKLTGIIEHVINEQDY